jgi:thiol-disulfide isomerase/thioredoxin
MIRAGSFLAALLVVGGLVTPVPSALAQSCEDLEQKLDELTRRVEALERQSSRSRPAQQRAASNRAAREEATVLYGQVDTLIAQGKLEEANRSVAAFNEKHEGTQAASWIRSLTRELAVVGKAVPGDWFIEKWYQGESDVDLDGGRATVLIFWESWCPHCRTEVPKIQKLRDAHEAEGLQVLGVTRITRTATEESVTRFIAESGVTYPIAKETGALAEYFNVKGIPAAAIVKDGKIVWRGHPMRLTDELIDSWL